MVNWVEPIYRDVFGNIYDVNKINYFEKETNMEEKLNKFIEENEIKVDENGNFEMYIVVDADDKEHTLGTIFNGKETETYCEKRAYEDLKEEKSSGLYSRILSLPQFSFPTITTEVKRKTTIKEDLMTLKDKMFKVLVNKSNVTKVTNDIVFVNKYKVIEAVELMSTLKFKINTIRKDNITVLLYNSLTEKSKTIDISIESPINSIDDVKSLIGRYLFKNEQEVELINSIIEDGEELF